MSDSPRSVVIISTHIALFERLVGDAGFSVAGAADLMVNGERLVELFDPSFVIYDSDLPGEQDTAAIARLRQAAPNARIVLVVSQNWALSDTGSLGVSAILGRDDLLELGPLLLDLETAAQTTDHFERRSGRDRRQVQDWTKIGWEYRTTTRRADDRRDEPVPT
ncbi:MAG: response regulator [Actinomycetota bacterium]